MRAFALLLLIALFPNSASAETLEPSSRITEVTVFPDRALVTRQAEMKLEKGTHEIRFASLPAGLEEASLSARGEGQAQVKLFGARLAVRELGEAASPKIRELETALEGVQDKMRAAENAREVVRQKKEYLQSIRAASADQVGKDLVTKQPDVQDVAGLLRLIEQEFEAAFKKEIEIDAEWRSLERERGRLERELGNLRGQASRQEWQVLVDLEAVTAGPFTLEIAYRAPGASWEPVYEARAAAEKTEILFESHAIIRQGTGEDWENVTLRLSTANPSIGGRMPEIEPRYLRRYEPPPQVSQRAGVMMEMSALGKRANYADAKDEMEAAGAMPMAPVPAEVPQARVESRGPAVTYTLPKQETVRSDWQPRKTLISGRPLKAEFEYEVTPRLSTHAYWRAKAKNDSDALFMAGPVQIFVDGAFTGSSSIDAVGPGETFDLFLGAEERIRVEQKEVKAKVDVSILPGVHGRIRTVDYEYLTTIENFRPAASKITVFDHVPVSQHDEIKVEQVSTTPPWAEEDAEKPGVKKWKFELAQGAKTQVRLSYRVKHPVEYRVEGL